MTKLGVGGGVCVQVCVWEWLVGARWLCKAGALLGGLAAEAGKVSELRVTSLRLPAGKLLHAGCLEGASVLRKPRSEGLLGCGPPGPSEARRRRELPQEAALRLGQRERGHLAAAALHGQARPRVGGLAHAYARRP